jgi:hypothetical protein
MRILVRCEKRMQTQGMILQTVKSYTYDFVNDARATIGARPVGAHSLPDLSIEPVWGWRILGD